MTKQGFIGKKFDQVRESRADKTREHDLGIAYDMAQTEKDYRDHAAVSKQVGKALVSAMWSKYPDVKGDKTVSVDELSERTDGKITNSRITAEVGQGIRDVANDYSKTPPAMTERGLDRQIAREAEIREADPSNVPHDLAQKVGYRLQDNAKAMVQQGVLEAEALQAQQLAGNAEQLTK